MSSNRNLFYVSFICIKKKNDSFIPTNFHYTYSNNLEFHISGEEMHEICKTSELRYAKFQSFSTVMSMLSFGASANKLKNKSNAGVITLSGPHALDVADSYAEVIVTKGERFLNPIQFPYTLHSAVACELAAYHEIKSFALSTGYDTYSLLDALQLASNFLKNNLLREIILSCGGFLQPYFIQDENRKAISVSALISASEKIDSIGVVAFPFARNPKDILKLKQKYLTLSDNYYEFGTDRDEILTKMPLVWVIEFLKCLQNFHGNGLSMIMVKKNEGWQGIVLDLSKFVSE